MLSLCVQLSVVPVGLGPRLPESFPLHFGSPSSLQDSANSLKFQSVFQEYTPSIATDFYQRSLCSARPEIN